MLLLLKTGGFPWISRCHACPEGIRCIELILAKRLCCDCRSAEGHLLKVNAAKSAWERCARTFSAKGSGYPPLGRIAMSFQSYFCHLLPPHPIQKKHTHTYLSHGNDSISEARAQRVNLEHAQFQWTLLALHVPCFLVFHRGQTLPRNCSSHAVTKKPV